MARHVRLCTGEYRIGPALRRKSSGHASKWQDMVVHEPDMVVNVQDILVNLVDMLVNDRTWS